MALSNILNEPLKELSETLVGFVVIGTPLGIDYYWANWFIGDYHPRVNDPGRLVMLVVAMLMGVVALIVGWAMLL